MMNDNHRNECFKQAIQKLVKPDDLILDIGTGSGLLAMYSRDAGSQQVVACEQNHLKAEDAKKISSYLGTDHQELYLSEKDLLDTIMNLPNIYSEPFADSSQIPTILLSKLTRSKVTVSLSGDGGDEIFGGYGRYFLGQRVKSYLGFLPYNLRKAIKSSKLINLQKPLITPLKNQLTINLDNLDHFLKKSYINTDSSIFNEITNDG